MADPDPNPTEATFHLYYLPHPHDERRYDSTFASLASRYPLLTVSTLVGSSGAVECGGLGNGPAFVLYRGDVVVAEARGSLPDREILSLVGRALSAGPP